ncbi:NADH dehydrogenase [ubiquinone] 1 beta subcomplex subunit 10 [Rhinatrema bivittatum]|uniref:NADH dehydrogenase [ubiquinone] 1 beta subcomplex subunit 10 n=1 Tax=Rhinatrema bivittatum TaxID=194408 RepID=UPI001125FBBB|nr:NADH dehydrogenase [ubiquinone] 1 beta subcomplex subunit 10 [Rhinatrema bivittatum]
MPDDWDKDVYSEPPPRSPDVVKETKIPNPALIFQQLYYYSVDVPVTAFREWVERQRSRKFYYYHQKFRRVPDLTECEVGDYLCQFEANIQWKRDHKVDQEIVKIVQERLRSCQQREGNSHIQNCAELLEQFGLVCKAYQSRYGELGAYEDARKCLMKQKHRMIEERRKAAT